MKIKCRGYVFIDDYGQEINLPCPKENHREFKNKPSFFRCNLCWRKMIDQENLFIRQGKIITIADQRGETPEYKSRREFLDKHYSYYGPGPYGDIPYNSSGEPLESKYLEWFYKQNNPEKYAALLAKKKESRSKMLGEIEAKKEAVQKLMHNMKVKSLISKLANSINKRK